MFDRFRSLRVLVLVLISFSWINCAKKVDEGKIPISTSSEEARKEFLQGRDLSEKLLLTNAIEHFDKAIALDSNFATAHLYRANASFTGTDFFDHLKKAIALSEKASESERLLILGTEAAVNNDLRRQQECFEKLVALNPRDERAHYNLGGYFYGQQEYEKAVEHYTKASEIAPAYSPVYNILGYSYKQLEKFPQAEKAFAKYIELIPNDPNPYDSYAELLMKTGRFDESITNYKKALTIDPYFSASRTGTAANYMYKGMPDEAAAELQKLMDMARNDGERRQALFTRMVLNVDAGKMDLALQDLEKQYALGEKTKDVATMAGDLGFKGNILLEMGRYDDALASFAQSLQLMDASDLSREMKENARFFHHYNVAAVAIGKKDLKKAKVEAEAFANGAEARKNPIQTQIAHQLNGMVSLAEKKYDAAIKELLQSNMQNPYALFRLGVAYKGAGDKVKAKEFFSKTVRFYGLPGLNYAFVRAKAEKMLAGM